MTLKNNNIIIPEVLLQPKETWGEKESPSDDNYWQNKVREFAKSFFAENFLAPASSNDKHPILKERKSAQMLDEIIEQSEIENEGEKRSLTRAEASKIFSEELLNFLEKHREDENYETIFKKTKEVFFYHTTDVFGTLKLADHFDLTTRATRADFLSQDVKTTILRNLAYQIGVGYQFDKNKDNLFSNYTKSSVAEKIDKINLLESLYAELNAPDNPFQPSAIEILKLINQIEEQNDNLFIGYYLDYGKEKIKKESANPSRASIRWTNNMNDARLSERLVGKERKEAERLNLLINPDRALTAEENMVQVAEDTIAIYNHANSPVAYAKVNFEEAGELKKKISSSDLKNLKKALAENTRSQSSLELSKLFQFANLQVLNQFYGLKEDDFEKQAKIWSDFSHNLSVEEWRDFFDFPGASAGIVKELGNILKKMEEKKDETNFQATTEVYNLFEQHLPAIAEGYQGKRPIQQLAIRFHFERAKGDDGELFSTMNVLGALLSYSKPGDFSDEESFQKARSLANAVENLRQKHIENYKANEEAGNDLADSFNFKHQEKLKRFNEVLRKIRENRVEIIEKLTRKITEIEAGVNQEKINVNFTGFKKFAVKEEGDYLSNENLDETALLLEHLHEPRVRERIEADFLVNFKKIPFHYQVAFLKFLSDKNRTQANEVKDFIRQGETEEERISRFKSFLALEADVEAGEAILNIADQTKEDPKSADKLFGKYSQIADSAKKTAEYLADVSQEIFFERKIDKSEVIKYLIKTANDLLLMTGEAIKNIPKEKAPFIIEKLIGDLDIQQRIREQQVKEFQTIIEQLNEVELQTINFGFDKILGAYFWEHDRSAEFSLYQDTIADFPKEKQNAFSQDFDKTVTSNNLKFLKEKKPATARNLLTYEELWKKYQINFGVLVEKYLDYINKYLTGFSGTAEQANNFSGEFADWKSRIERINSFRESAEHKFEEVVFGHESAVLPDNFEKSITDEILEYSPELPNESRAYLPVGISSQLPKEKEAHIKPIDALAYIFWLQNQGQKTEFMVVDTIQTSNYEALHNLNPEEARRQASINGERDESWYQAVINIFGLKNIQIKDYSSLENSAEFKKAKVKINRLDKKTELGGSSILTRAFDSLAPESIGRKTKATESEQKLLREYGKTEIALILAQGGRKISHGKEYPYDVLARLIPIYGSLKEKREEIKKILAENLRAENISLKKISKALAELDDDQTLIELSLYLAYYQNYPKIYQLMAELFALEEQRRNLKQTTDPEKIALKKDLQKRITSLKAEIADTAKDASVEEKTVKPINEAIKSLGLLPKGREAKNVISERKKLSEILIKANFLAKIKLPEFCYPQKVVGASFIGSREFYSTWKGEHEEELPLEANQVIASSNPLAGAKLMMLNEKKQREYAEKVLKPLLVNYYLATSKNKAEAISRLEEDFKEVKTISDIINLIQEKIILPIEAELKQKG